MVSIYTCPLNASRMHDHELTIASICLGGPKEEVRKYQLRELKYAA